MPRSRSFGLLGILFGSPFALLGLVFLLRGKAGIGIPFLMMGLLPALSGTVVGGRAAPPAGDRGAQPPEVADGTPTSAVAAADRGRHAGPGH